ncbi:MAG TPA: hypothetical protein VK997_14215 [Deferrisomatales bacterium]|nr:hypothetical protein [Deferrisomatales bacterium]
MAAAGLLVLAGGALAGLADVVGVEAAQEADSRYRFTVTVRHEDSDWEHYADRWEVLSPEGKVLGTRVLLHPHVGEQPFTRSLGGVEVAPGMKHVRVRARDSVHGFGGEERLVELRR